MNTKQLFYCVFLLAATLQPVTASADTYVIPFSEIRQAMYDSNNSPDAVIHDYLARQIREELEALGLDLNGGLVFGEVPVAEVTEIIRTDCNFPSPYEIHIDSTKATITIDDSSSLTIDFDSIRSFGVGVDLAGTIYADANAWVRWGQDILFVGDCVKIDTDHGWLGLSLPFEIDLELILDLYPSFDNERIAIVVDKHASVAGQVQFIGGDLQHDFGSLSLTDLVISAFKDELLTELTSKGEQAVADALTALNYRLDGRNSIGAPDPNIEAFNGPTTFVLDVSEDDRAFIKDVLREMGIPDIVLAIIEDRGAEVLLQLAVLEGADRDAYLASLGAEVSCEALLGKYQIQLDTVPIYRFNGQVCEAADPAGQIAESYFSDTACTNEIAFSPTEDSSFCVAQIGDQAKNLVGNAAAWVPDSDQPDNPLPGIASKSWTTLPSTQLDLGVVSVRGNHQPYMKQIKYKTIGNVPRGNGSCDLELRVYKSDITEQGLTPLMAIHGGTWQHRGLSFWGLEAGISHLTERGFIVFAPFYRLVGESDGNIECNGASWHEVTEDVESALDWISQYGPALGAAQKPVSVYGQSAGAHLAAWLAAHRSDDVRNALLFYGPIDTLDFLAGAVALGGPYETYRGFGLRALARFFGAHNGMAELRLEQMNFAGLTPALLSQNWPSLIPGGVFNLTLIEPLSPPVYVARCAAASQTDLSAINLSMPPNALIDCMKHDLSDFLVDNSFNHLLSAEEVPVFLVHGSGDTLVPHAQALGLCGSMDGSVLPIDVIDPLTTYACGVASHAQIVKDAEHALELGVCLGPLCPAGEPGSPTRDAVATAVEAAYGWLIEDPSLPNPEPPVFNTINIVRAVWYASTDKLAIQVTSDLGDEAGLRIMAYLENGDTVTKPLKWHAEKNRWWIILNRFSEKYGSPTTVTVSGAEGSNSAQVEHK